VAIWRAFAAAEATWAPGLLRAVEPADGGCHAAYRLEVVDEPQMNTLEFLAYHSHSYGGGWGNWLAHVTVSSLVHSLIYGLVFKMMHRLTMGEAVVLAVVVIGCVFFWGRSRDRQRW
jgi:hypothetical protein